MVGRERRFSEKNLIIHCFDTLTIGAPETSIEAWKRDEYQNVLPIDDYNYDHLL